MIVSNVIEASPTITRRVKLEGSCKVKASSKVVGAQHDAFSDVVRAYKNGFRRDVQNVIRIPKTTKISRENLSQHRIKGHLDKSFAIITYFYS